MIKAFYLLKVLNQVHIKFLFKEQLLIPFSQEQMICLKTGVKENRKVAKPNLDLFEVI
jgi:hypothetical protein